MIFMGKSGWFPVDFPINQSIEYDYPGGALAVGRGQDWPRFCWRGLQLDAVRHFMPVSFVMLGAALLGWQNKHETKQNT